MAEVYDLETKKNKRLHEWQAWMAEFQTLGIPIEPIPYAAELLNDYYWRLMIDYIQPLMGGEERNLHYYKLISTCELTIMSVLPYRLSEQADDAKLRFHNAEFAWFVGTCIFVNWRVDGKPVIDTDKLEEIVFHQETIDRDGEDQPIIYPMAFIDEHIEYLQSLNLAGPLPIIGNSLTWRMLYLACKI